MEIKRDVYSKVLHHLEDENLLIISGPASAGKTTLLKKIQQDLSKKQSVYYITLENQKNLECLNESAHNLFELIPNENGKKQLVLIDEVQNLANPENFFRTHRSLSGKRVKFILSYEGMPQGPKEFFHPGEGKKIFPLFPLSFCEFLEFKNREILKFFNACFPPARRNGGIPRKFLDEFDSYFFEYVKYGGYPNVVSEPSTPQKELLLEGIINSFINNQVPRTGIRNNLKLFKLMKLLAEKVGDMLNLSELSATLELSIPTVENYIRILQDKWFIKTLCPYSRSIYKKEVTKMPKLHFSDCGIRNSLLNNFGNLSDRLDRDKYFENIIFNLFSSKEGIKKISYWRTQNRHEVDFIINDKYAFDTRFSGQALNPVKYKVFKKLYPDMELNFIAYDRRAEGHLSVLEI